MAQAILAQASFQFVAGPAEVADRASSCRTMAVAAGQQVVAAPTAAPQEDVEEDWKMSLRQQVWNSLETADAVLFPRPCHGRIPNCVCSPDACRRLLDLPQVRGASVVKVHPSIGAAALRTALVAAGKTVLVPPYPGETFLYLRLHRSLVPNEAALARAGDKREYLRWAVPLLLEEIPLIDIVVVATCVVAPNGVRLGKGKGYGEVEWGILTEIGAVDPAKTLVFTICHDLQVVGDERLSPTMVASHDLPVDAVATPSRLIWCRGPQSAAHMKPSGVRWDLVGAELEHDIGALKVLRQMNKTELENCRAACGVSWRSCPGGGA